MGCAIFLLFRSNTTSNSTCCNSCVGDHCWMPLVCCVGKTKQVLQHGSPSCVDTYVYTIELNLLHIVCRVCTCTLMLFFASTLLQLAIHICIPTEHGLAMHVCQIICRLCFGEYNHYSAFLEQSVEVFFKPLNWYIYTVNCF